VSPAVQASGASTGAVSIAAESKTIVPRLSAAWEQSATPTSRTSGK
jgi:hypothetical protein